MSLTITVPRDAVAGKKVVVTVSGFSSEPDPARHLDVRFGTSSVAPESTSYESSSGTLEICVKTSSSDEDFEVDVTSPDESCFATQLVGLV